MGLACCGNKVYDWFKGTWIASQLFFHGERFRHFEVITIEGVMLDCEHQATDSDETFDVQTAVLLFGNPLPNWHCEVTKCASDALHKQAGALRPGDKVRVTGNRTYDPTHFGMAGHWEIHPVTAICKLT